MDAAPQDSLIAAIGPIVGHLGDYWLDSGTLLGLIRSGRLINWDSDIDLGIWEKDAARAVAAIPQFRALDMQVTTRSYKGRIYGLTMQQRDTKLPPVHVHVYFRDGDTAWSPQTVSYAKVARPNAAAGFKGPAWVRDLLLGAKAGALARHSGTPLQRLYRMVVCLPVWGALVVLRSGLDRQYWSSLWPLSTMHATYTWLIPAHLFETFTTIDHDGATLTIPVAAETYLAKRYGEWRQPKQDWCYWTDDGCIVPLAPDVALAMRDQRP